MSTHPSVARSASAAPAAVRGRPAAVRAVVAAWILLAAAVAIALFVVQWSQVQAPCTVPDCVWPELSDAGVAQLTAVGVPAWVWWVAGATISLAVVVISLSLAVMLLRADGVHPLAAAPFAGFALGPFSDVLPAGPAQAAVRVIALASWFSAFALFPTGRFRPRWVAVAPAAAAAWTVVLALPTPRTAVAANDPLWWALTAGGYICCVAIIVAGLVVQFVHGDAVARRGIRLLLFALVPFVAFGAVQIPINARLDADAHGFGSLGGGLAYLASSILTVVLFVTIGVAMMRHGAFGARVAADRLLVATVSLSVAALVYTTTVLVVSLLARGWFAQAVAAVVTAVVLAGVYGRVATAIGRLWYGEADDPAALATALDHTIAVSVSPDDLVGDLAGILATRLRFPGIRIDAPDGPPVQVGSAAGRTARVEISVGVERDAEITATLRPHQRRLTQRDVRALRAAAGPLTSALAARRLSADLARSQREVVVSRDDERRALRRRLHDEVGPTLAMARHRVDAAQTDAAQWAIAARTIDDALEQVRAISRDLRPPALDEVGLRGALVAAADGLPIDVAVDAPIHLSPSAVEVAVYRIVVESLVNAARHGRAAHAQIAISVADGACTCTVDDDGAGRPGDVGGGVGVTSMHERAALLRGTVAFVPSPLGGIRVHATLPVDSPSSTDGGSP